MARLFTAGRNSAADGIADTIGLVSLHTGSPGTAGNSNEVSGGAYARASTTGSAWTESSGETENNAVVSFPDATAAWGTVSHVVLRTAGGAAVIGMALTTAMAIPSGATEIQFAAGALTFNVPVGDY